MIYFTLSLSGDKDVVRGLEDFEGRASDLTPVWPMVDKVFEMIVANQFATEGQHGGQAWPELAESTQAERRRLGYGPGHPILRRTGRLQRSLTLPRGADVLADVLSVHEPQRYVRGSQVPYLVYHQSLDARKKIPRRAVIQFTDADKNELFRPLRVYLSGAAKFDKDGALKLSNRELNDYRRNELHQGPGGIR